MITIHDINQSEMKYGKLYSKRHGIYGGPLNRRKQATISQYDEWIATCLKDVEEGRMEFERGKKIIKRWWTLREKKKIGKIRLPSLIRKRSEMESDLLRKQVPLRRVASSSLAASA